MNDVSVVDYGAGNLGSVLRALEALGCSPRVVREARDVRHCGKVIFPGVGAAGQAMTTLRSTGLGDALRAHVDAGKPLLGICVGMQLLGTHSQEDDTACLGILPFHLEKFRTSEPVPHMGWNSLEFLPSNSACAAAAANLPGVREANVGTEDASGEHGPDVYFVHSYCAPVTPESQGVALATTSYGGTRFVSAVARGNVWGMQFHVEKSGRVGLALIRNFIEAF